LVRVTVITAWAVPSFTEYAAELNCSVPFCSWLPPLTTMVPCIPPPGKPWSSQ
jgi:hypothetical protein